jgi:hypothetical protein
VAERYASKEFLGETKREILDSIRDLARRIEDPWPPDRDWYRDEASHTLRCDAVCFRLANGKNGAQD